MPPVKNSSGEQRGFLHHEMRCHRGTVALGICILAVTVVGVSLFCTGTFGLCPKCLALGLHGQPRRPTQGCLSAPMGRCTGVPVRQTLKKVVFLKGFGLPSGRHLSV